VLYFAAYVRVFSFMMCRLSSLYVFLYVYVLFNQPRVWRAVLMCVLKNRDLQCANGWLTSLVRTTLGTQVLNIVRKILL
jgi:hypothetical protein